MTPDMSAWRVSPHIIQGHPLDNHTVVLLTNDDWGCDHDRQRDHNANDDAKPVLVHCLHLLL